MSRRGHSNKVSRITSYLPLNAWPAADQSMWKRITAHGDVFDRVGRGASWSPRTIENVAQGYGKWMKWVALNLRHALMEDPLVRVTRDRVALYMDYLLTEGASAFTVQLNLQRLGQMMAAATETKEFGWLFEAANRLKPRSVRNKRARTVPSYRLADLGFSLMREAQSMAPSWHTPPAARFRNGLLIALLAFRPVRLGNLMQMALGQHLTRSGTGYEVRFTEHETKTGTPIEFPIPSSLTPYLGLYLDTYRPQLAGREDVASLWVSRDGGPMTPNWASAMVSGETRRALGFHVNPHMFRDCAATTIALDDPEHAFAIAAILGHSTMATSERYYNQARMVEAGTAVHAILAKRRKNRAP